MGRTADYSRQSCSVAATLEVIGDPWTMLVIRDAFNGVRRFEQWQERLGVARNVLAARLKSLVHHGVLEPRPYSERPPRNEYVLTAKGKDLFDVLYAMRNWSERWAYAPGETGGGPAMRYTHRACGADVGTATICPNCGEALRYGDLKGEPSAALKAEQAARGG